MKDATNIWAPAAATPHGCELVVILGRMMLPFWFMTVRLSLPAFAIQTLLAASKSKPRGSSSITGGSVLPSMRETVLSPWLATQATSNLSVATA
ncbi:hypothetical protein D3C72_1693660 [compost metagenome]